MRAATDPAAWLAAQDILAYLDARRNADPLEIGREALAMTGGDLEAACRQQEDLRAEICLAWLSQQIERQPDDAIGFVRLAADTLAAAEASTG